MTELRSAPTFRSPKGKLDAMWDHINNTFTIRDTHLHIDRIYHLHDDGTYELEEVPYATAA